MYYIIRTHDYANGSEAYTIYIPLDLEIPVSKYEVFTTALYNKIHTGNITTHTNKISSKSGVHMQCINK